jgi:hypothetical protein
MATPQPQGFTDKDVDVMLAEYSAILALRGFVVTSGETRLNIYLAVIAAGIAGLQYINTNLAPNTAILVGSAIYFGLLSYGTLTFMRIVGRASLLIEFTAAMNRIRAFFVAYNGELRPYFILPVPKTVEQRELMADFARKMQRYGLPPLYALLNALLVGLGMGLLLENTLQYHWLFELIASLIVGIIVFVVQYLYMGREMRKAVAKVPTA